ncbi:MAG: hypothetical protein EKK55_01820 [Rhodocyclaceae bacterium]|nr:MAG: hypothetical protein EKK55_01820 [Rhodocyclaceae bacterium]
MGAADLAMLVAFGLLTVAGVACRLAANDRGDGPLLDVARLLEVLLGADLVRWALSLAVLEPARALGRTPFEGATRWAFHATQALFLAWSFGVVVLAWRLLARGPFARVFAGVWAAIAALLAAGYPELRGAALGDLYRWIQLAAIGLALLAVAAPRPRTFRAGRAHLCTCFLIAGLGAELAGPYLAKNVFTAWWVAQATWMPVLVAVALAATWSRPWGLFRTS